MDLQSLGQLVVGELRTAEGSRADELESFALGSLRAAMIRARTIHDTHPENLGFEELAERQGGGGDISSFLAASDSSPLEAAPTNYIDFFSGFVYDPNFAVGPDQDISTTIVLFYPNGTETVLNVKWISDETMSLEDTAAQVSGAHVASTSGLAMPDKFNKSTTPNLWAAKKKVYEEIDRHNLDLMMTVVSDVVLFFVLWNAGGVGASNTGGSSRTTGRFRRETRPRQQVHEGKPAKTDPKQAPESRNPVAESHVESTISASRGHPVEVYFGLGKLSSRQRALLSKLTKPLDRLVVRKKDVNARDLAALTAKENVEFAMFTRRGERMIVRGTKGSVPMTPTELQKLADDGWRWSAHSHPGQSDLILQASGHPGDRAVIEIFGQEQSMIVNSLGRRNVFSQTTNRIIQ